MVKHFWEILIRPEIFFENTKNEITEVRNLLGMSIFFIILAMIWNYKAIPNAIPVSGLFSNLFVALVSAAIVFVILAFVYAVLGSVILYYSLKIAHEPTTPEKVFFVYVLGLSPFFLLGWITQITILTILYTFYIHIYGLAKILNLPKKKVILPYVIHLALLSLTMTLIYYIFILIF